MSKPFRTATQTRRGARGGFPEHDDFEGLPVRQWRQEYVHVAPPSQSETSQQNDRWAIELPFGLPKEYPLLPPHTQELLRAARSGRLYKRPAPEEEDGDAEASDIKGEKKDAEPAAEGYTVKMWKQMPRNVEVPAVSHLAKRPRNIITLASKTLAPQITGPTVRRVTVRHIDAAGNPYERTVTLSEGQTVDGEIISMSILPAPTATAPELAPQQLTPVKRRPPPPKRKPKGPGRGRKKKLPLPIPLPRREPGEGGETTGVKDESVGPDGVKIEDGEDSTMQDSEMADNSAMPSDDEEGDESEEGEGGEGDEQGEEGSQAPDVRESSNQDQDQEMTDAQPPEVVRPSSIEEPEETPRAPSSEEDITISKPRLPPPSLGSLGPLHGLTPPNIGGSPLKNVIIQSPTDLSPMISPRGGSFTSSSYMDVHTSSMSVDANGSTITETFVSETIVEIVQGSLPTEESLATSLDGVAAPLPESSRVEELSDAPEAPTPTTAGVDKSPEPKQESPAAPVPEIIEPVAESIAESAVKTTPPSLEPPQPEVQPNSAPRSPLEPPKSPTLLPAVTEDEDDGLNLLGSLERELDRQERVSSAGSNVGEAQKVTPPAVAPEAEPVKPAPAEETGVEKSG